MAFQDPVAAFSNFRRMMKPSGRLAFVCWRTLEENELDLLPLRAAGLEEWLDPTPFRFADSAPSEPRFRQPVSGRSRSRRMTHAGFRRRPHIRIFPARGNQAALNAATWVVTARP